MKYDSIDHRIISLLQGDLPLESHPFANIAQELDVSEQDIVDRILAMRQKGLMRRWGAVLRHQQAGYDTNAMVVWAVDEEKADEVGLIMSGYREISHCYFRQVPDSLGGYSLFAMIHARSQEQLLELIAAVSKQTGLRDYIIIRSVREFKKISMKYV